jgi:HAD superfamily hydrolase (TIGR01450 family)
LISLERKSLFLFDLDGVFWKGKENPSKIGGTRIVRKIRERGKKLLVLTNDSTDSSEEIYERFRHLEIDVKREEILTSGMLAADYMVRKFGNGSKYLLVGEDGLDKELMRAGLKPSKSANADVVVIGLDRQLTYDLLEQARQAVTNGAEIIATHKSRVFMYKNGPAMAAGPIVAALEYATGKKATAIGKPSPLMFKIALKKAACQKDQAVMIGDQLDTDILGANRVGIDSILVRTGIDRKASKEIRPSAVIRSVDDLADFI